jgi:hypothetical protein
MFYKKTCAEHTRCVYVVIYIIFEFWRPVNIIFDISKKKSIVCLGPTMSFPIFVDLTSNIWVFWRNTKVGGTFFVVEKYSINASAVEHKVKQVETIASLFSLPKFNCFS